jgi:hypothetical protein
MVEPLDNQEAKPLPVRLEEKMFGQDDRFLFGRLGVHGDGTCFFHSLCAALNEERYLYRDSPTQQDIGHRFRSKFTQNITPERWDTFKRENKVQNAVTIDKLVTQFHDDQHWADETMIKLVSDVLELNILFIDMDKSKMYCGVRGEKDEPLIVILWVNHSHFEPMFRILDEDIQSHKLLTQFKFSLFDKQDKEVVDIMMSNYNAQCPHDAV